MTEPDDLPHRDRIAALFREAADTTPPPPGFDHDAVVTRSRRVTARRRSAVLGGAMALLVVAGVGAAVALPLGEDAASTAAAPAMAPAPEAGRAGDAGGSAESAPFAEEPGVADSSVPDALVGVPPFTGTPLGPGTTECAQRQDPELRALVEQVLPEVVGAPEGAVTMECRPGGERGVALEVDDAGATGLLGVEYQPPGAPVGDDPGAVAASAPTASGGTVVVRSRGAGPGAPVPFEGRLDTVASFLAPRL